MARVLAIRELMLLQLQTAFIMDPYGRLVAINEPGSPPPPRLVTMTGHGERIVRVRRDVPEKVGRDWIASSSEEELRNKVVFHQQLENEYRGPAYVFPKLSAQDGAEVIHSEHKFHPQLVARGWKLVETPPYVGVVRDGFVVAVCYSSRGGTGACEAGVETATDYRGMGLGALAVQGWAYQVQESGRIAFYSTTYDNRASQRIAQKLGAQQFGEIWHLT